MFPSSPDTLSPVDQGYYSSASADNTSEAVEDVLSALRSTPTAKRQMRTYSGTMHSPGPYNDGGVLVSTPSASPKLGTSSNSLASSPAGPGTSSSNTPVSLYKKQHSAKTSISSSVSFGANRANLKRARTTGSGSGLGFQPNGTSTIINNNPFLPFSSSSPQTSSPSRFADASSSRDDGAVSAPLLGNSSSAIVATSAARASFFDSSAYWLSLYFFFNLSLTLYNKLALVSFPFPWTLTCIHSLCAFLGSWIALRQGYFLQSGALQLREKITLLAFSTLYTVNIAVSNLSLNLVSVPVHQVVRSTTPLFTMLISIVLFQKRYLLETYVSLLIVVFGICLATYGDYSYTSWGLFLTLFGALLAAIKGIATNRIMVGRLKFHPLDLLLRMSPLAFGQCFVFSCMSGEISQVYQRAFVEQSMGRGQWLSLFVNGVIAFGLNVVSFTANKKTGALTMSVAANVKQVLTIVLAVIIFNLVINGTNLVGIALTIAGGAYYSYIEYQSKQARAAGVALPPPSPLPGTPSAMSLSLPGAGRHAYYEKLSPLPTESKNVFLDAQEQQRQQQQQDSDTGLARPSGRAEVEQETAREAKLNEKAAYHRKQNSLAVFREFQYPRSVPNGISR